MYGGHWWGMGFGWITGLIFLIVIIWLIIKVLNHDSYYHKSHTNSSASSSAMNILKERYAKGEISKEEFQEKKKHIEE